MPRPKANETKPDPGADGDPLAFTPLESLALLRCRVRENYAGIWRDVKDTEQIANTLAICETHEILEQSGGELDYWEAHEKAEIVVGALVAAYISAKVKISFKTGAPFDLKLPKASPEIEMLKEFLAERQSGSKSEMLDEIRAELARRRGHVANAGAPKGTGAGIG